MAEGIILLDKKALLFIQEKFMQVKAFERYIPFTAMFEIRKCDSARCLHGKICNIDGHAD